VDLVARLVQFMCQKQEGRDLETDEEKGGEHALLMSDSERVPLSLMENASATQIGDHSDKFERTSAL
jgi:hypothetical protein